MRNRYDDFVDIVKVIVPLMKKDESDKYLKPILENVIRQIEKVSPVYVSKRAQQKADEQKIGTLKQYKWSDQIKKMKDDERKIYHWEHYYPVSQQIRDLRDLLKNGSFTDENIRHIVQRTRICWILKEENKLLNYKYKSNRPNPESAYKEVGIELLN